ncbi:hypothetical protein GCM10009780_21330 [Actinomadura alba]
MVASGSLASRASCLAGAPPGCEATASIRCSARRTEAINVGLRPSSITHREALRPGPVKPFADNGHEDITNRGARRRIRTLPTGITHAKLTGACDTPQEEST